MYGGGSRRESCCFNAASFSMFLTPCFAWTAEPEKPGAALLALLNTPARKAPQVPTT